MTVTVRPGKPNAAASSFFSGVIREPLAGVPAICPVDASVSHPVSSPARTIEALIRVFEASRDEMRGRLALNLPALNVTVQQMLDALETVAGPKVRALVTFQRDERIAGIVANWPKGASAARANALGLKGDASFDDIIRQYIADCRLRPEPTPPLRLMNQIDLKGRVAVITGGAQGIGYAVAERFIASGAKAVLWDIDEALLAKAQAPLSATRPRPRASNSPMRAVASRHASGAGTPRPHRHPGQQRRHHRRQRADVGAVARDVAAHDRRQPGRALPHLPRHRAGDDQGKATAVSSTWPRWPARKATPTPATTAPARRG